MLKLCLESEREWDEGLPLLLFAVKGTPKESLRFSSCDLVFGLTVRVLHLPGGGTCGQITSCLTGEMNTQWTERCV